MKPDWTPISLRDISESVKYGYTASADLDPVGPKFLRITDIVDPLIDWETVPYCRIDQGGIEKYKLQHGDIVVARTGATSGYAKWLKHPPEAVFASYLVRFRVKPEYHNHFIGLIVESQEYKEFIKKNISGAAQPQANAQVLGSFPLHIPPLSAQRRIAAILSAYDDLIENNTRRIKILQEMAQLIYREWFVEFRFPGHEKMKVKNGMPEGWRIKTVGDLLAFHINGGWGEQEATEQFTVKAYVIRGTDIPGARSGQFDEVPNRYHKLSNFESRQLRLGDIVMEISGGSKGQPVGRALLVSQQLLDAFGNQVICAK